MEFFPIMCRAIHCRFHIEAGNYMFGMLRGELGNLKVKLAL